MEGKNKIVFHRGYNILKSKYGTYRLLPLNVITVAGLREAAEKYGYSYMYNAHPEFDNLADCVAYIDKNFPKR